MTTWAQLLADIRLDLKDTAATKKYSDETLYLYLKDAVRTYSLYFPRRIDRFVLTLEDGSYALPPDLVNDVFVECPEDRFLERRLERPGARYTAPGKPTLYYLAGGRVYLDRAPSGDDPVLLTYEAVHAIPAGADDSDFAFTIPALDEELVRLYVKAKAMEQTRGQQAGLDRFKLGSGSRDDNPLKPEVGNLMQDFYDKVAERIPGEAIQLWRPGRLR